jgi:signal transduction histidine kinase
MVMLVTDLLLTEQLTSGKIRLEKEVTDVGALARSVVEANQLMAKRKSQRLTITTGGHCLATIDENRIYQSMENLVSNAIKYCGEGKSIHVEVQHHGHSIRFSVQDHGPGFTDIERQKLFRRFVRLSARPTGGEHSTGLGLSVVKRLVELHGGTVGAISEGTNKGSTFFFDIPAERIAVLAP